MSMNREQELQHRNDELLMKLTNVVDGYNQLQATIEKQAAKIAELEASEKEGWRYADELEQERKRLEAIIKASQEQETIVRMLISVARAAYFTLDDCEERDGDDGTEYVITQNNFNSLSLALDELDDLPEDLQPNVVMTGPAKAEFMLLSTYAKPVIKEQP